jgi:FkbM family methyltransferase
LLDRSGAYRDARELGAGRTEGCDGPIDVHGLRWWIPHQDAANTPGLEGRLRNGRLPFKSILAGRELAHGTIMLDIGANVGTTSIPRVVLGDFQHIYAAEPEPRNYMCLVQNVLANDLGGFVLPDRVAIGSEDGEFTMRLTTNIGAHRVLSGDPRRARPNRVVVPVRRLDTWVETLGIEPATIAFIKCDVQGWELRVMEGASRMLLQRHIAWQFEVSPKHLENAGTSLAEFCDAIRRSFDCFIDLTGQGPRTRTTKELLVALGDLGRVRRFTDILAYNTAT